MSSDPAHQRARPPAPARRRPAYYVQAAVMVFAMTACAGFLIQLGHETAVRLDLTATRRHRLAPQTLAVVDRVDRPLQLVLAVGLASLDLTARQGLLDVAAVFEAATPAAGGTISTTVIDTGSSSGLAQFDALVRSLVEQDQAMVSGHRAAVDAAAAAAERLGAALQTAAADVAALGDALAAPLTGPAAARAKAPWETQAAQLRVLADDLAGGAARAGELAKTAAEPWGLPRVDEAVKLVRDPLVNTANLLQALAAGLDQLARAPELAPDAKNRAALIARGLSEPRDQAARAAGLLDSLRPLRILTVARAVQRDRAVLLIDRGPAPPAAAPGEPPRPTVTAIDLQTLLSAPGGEVRWRAEDLIVSALGALAGGERPVVVLVHAERGRLGQRPTPFVGLAERLALRNIRLVEWPAGQLAEPPPEVIRLRAEPRRPLVYAIYPPDVRTPDAAERMGRLAGVVESLAAGGASMLVSVAPSTLPGAGSPDPMAAWLTALGVKAESGTVLLEEVRDGRGRAISVDQQLTEPGTDAAVAAAIDGVKTRLPWPIPLRLEPNPAAASKVAPLLTLPPRPELWGETQWLALRQGGGAGGFNALPTFEPERDHAGGPEPWVLAASIERADAGFERTQRIVVVGSAGWFNDGITLAASEVDGRRVADTPGNLAFLESSVNWLARQDDLLGASAQSQAVARIPALEPGPLAALRWSIAVLPALLVLLAGATFRWLRG